MRNDYLMIGLVLGIVGIVLIVAGIFTCGITCAIGIPLAIIGFIIFIVALVMDERPQPMAAPRVCISCGRPIDYYAQVCPWCGRDYRYPTYPAPPPPPSYPPPPPPPPPR